MGWQEYPENDDNFLPLTEDELREFQTKTEQVSTQRNNNNNSEFELLTSGCRFRVPRASQNINEIFYSPYHIGTECKITAFLNMFSCRM